MHAFITSTLDCNNALLFGVPSLQLAKLQRIQNSAARIVTGTKRHEHITPILHSLHWLRVKKRIDFKILTLTYRCLHDTAPAYLKDLLHPYQPTRSLRSASSLLLKVPRSKLRSYGDRAFSKAAPTLWNSLPKHIRESRSLESFKSALKTYLFEKEL